jgi:Resolvase, N terminal domain
MMAKPKRAALYVRVSTGHQSVENQIRELKEVVGRRGWTASVAPRDKIGGPASMPCLRMPADASSMSSWHGPSTGSADR